MPPALRASGIGDYFRKCSSRRLSRPVRRGRLSVTTMGTGQASVHIQRLAPSHAPVFLVNSRYPLVCATPQRSEGKPLHARGSPLYRRHGSDLPSSLTRIRSIALVFST